MNLLIQRYQQLALTKKKLQLVSMHIALLAWINHIDFEAAYYIYIYRERERERERERGERERARERAKTNLQNFNHVHMINLACTI